VELMRPSFFSFSNAASVFSILACKTFFNKIGSAILNPKPRATKVAPKVIPATGDSLAKSGSGTACPTIANTPANVHIIATANAKEVHLIKNFGEQSAKRSMHAFEQLIE